MRRIIGILCIALGLLCLLASAGFVMYNRAQAEAARESSQALLEKTQEIIRHQPKASAEPEIVYEETPRQMPAAEVEGYPCLGILSLPVLELELPVLDDWDYDRLKLAPCRYYGSCGGKDFVIAAHNYEAHFGRLSELQAGDPVCFTDMEGKVYGYEVVLLETLPPTATEEMITSGFDLSLYTCTPGGGNRVTVRCKKLET